MRWHLSHRFDPRALPLADRHYNRRNPGSPQFVPPAGCLVLLTENATAVWVTSTPYAEYVRHAWSGAWVNSLFRNEGAELASELIREAVAASLGQLGRPPELGMVTFIDRSKTRPKRDPGYCYLMAGFKPVGRTKAGLYALQMLPADMPAPARPLPYQPGGQTSFEAVAGAWG